LERTFGELYADFGELRSARAEFDRMIEAWAAGLGTGRLALEFTYSSRIGGRTRPLPAWRLVARMFKHRLAGLE